MRKKTGKVNLVVVIIVLIIEWLVGQWIVDVRGFCDLRGHIVIVEIENSGF